MDLQSQLRDYLIQHQVAAIISFSGGSDEKEAVITPIVEECIDYLVPYRVAIASGGTMFSVQKKAIDCALAAGLPTIGVMPERGIKYKSKRSRRTTTTTSRRRGHKASTSSPVFMLCRSSAAFATAAGLSERRSRP